MFEATVTEYLRAHGEIVVAVGPAALMAWLWLGVRQMFRDKAGDAVAQDSQTSDWDWPPRIDDQKDVA